MGTQAKPPSDYSISHDKSQFDDLSTSIINDLICNCNLSQAVSLFARDRIAECALRSQPLKPTDGGVAWPVSRSEAKLIL